MAVFFTWDIRCGKLHMMAYTQGVIFWAHTQLNRYNCMRVPRLTPTTTPNHVTSEPSIESSTSTLLQLFMLPNNHTPLPMTLEGIYPKILLSFCDVLIRGIGRGVSRVGAVSDSLERASNNC